MSFVERLRTWTKDHIGTQKDVADTFGYPVGTIAGWLSSGQFPRDQEFFVKLWEYGCNITYLFTGKGSKYADNTAGEILRKKNAEYNTDAEELLEGSKNVTVKEYNDLYEEYQHMRKFIKKALDA